MALNYLDKAAWDAGVYKDKGNDDDTQQDTSSEDSGYSASGILSAAKNFLEHPFQGTGTVIAPNYTPRPLDDSVYSDIPGTPVASGQFGELEDESVRDERMKDSADYMAANWPRLYGGVVAADEGLANVVGGIQNAVGGGNGILTNVQRAEEGMQNYRDQWNNEYGDSYFLNPNKFATDVGSGIGSTVPIMALSALMPGAAVAGGTRALTSALSRAGLGRLAMSEAGQALIADTVRSPISSLADSLSEYGTVVNDMMQNGMSEDEARRRAIPMFFKNMALDTFTVPLELGVMKGGKGIATSLLGRSAGEGVAKSIAKGAARTGMLAGASGLTEGYQEGAQNALENDVQGKRDGGWYNPFTWTNEDWEAARGGFVGGALMGVPGNVAAGFHPEARQAPLSAESQEQAQSIKDTLSHGKPAGMSNAAYNAYIELANSGNPDLIKQAASSLESFQQSQEGSQESTDDAATEAYNNYETYDQKQEIENFLDNNTVEQIGGEKNFNWLWGVLHNGTPEEVQHAYDTVIAAEKATAEQEAKNRPVSGGGSMSPNTGNAMANIVIQAANDSGVEPRLGLAIAARESGGDDVNAISMPEPHDGVYGVMQAQEETVSNMGLDSQYPDWKTDPYQNAMVGMAILKAKIDGENGDVWAGVRDYDGAGEEAEQYRQLVKNNYDNMGDIGGSGSGNVEAPSEAFYDLSEAMNPQVDGMDPNTMAKMNLLARDFYQKYGHRLLVTSLKRNGDGSSYHDEGHAFDFSDDFLEQNTDARDWLVQQGEKYGLKGLDEFSHPVATTDGGNVHFTDHGGPAPGGASSGVSGKVTSDNGQFERELDQAAQEAKSDMDKIQAQSDQAMNEIMNDDSTEKTAQDAQQDAENAQKQAEEGQQSVQDDVVPDVAQTIRDTSNNIDEINTLDGMFTKDSNGNDKFIDTPENRDFIKTNYKDEIAKAVNDALSKKKTPSATPVPKSQQQTPHARLGRILSTYERNGLKFKEYMNTFRNGTEQEQQKLADDLQTTQELERANSLKGNPLTTQQDQNAPQNAPQQTVESPKQPEQVNAPVQVKESLETQKKRKIYLAKKQKLMERVPAGKTVKVHASTNDAGFDATYKIVPAGDITASHDMNYAVNDLYPAEYQPRDRNRPQMRGQVEKMTKGMKPELLAESQFVNEGAPVVNNSGVVLNGNGRVMAVQKAYKGLTDAHKKSAKAYKDYLVSIAPSLGIAPEKVQSMDHPVLVRQAADDADTSAIINSTKPAGSGRVHQQEAGRVQSQEKEGNEVDEKSKQSDHVDAEPQQTESKDKESTHAEEGSQGDVQEEVSKFHNVLDDEKSTPKQIIDAYKSVVDKVIANANGSRKNAKIGDKIVTDEYQSLTNSKHWGAFMNEDGGRNWHEVATINANAHKFLRGEAKEAGMKEKTSGVTPYKQAVDDIMDKLDHKKLTPAQAINKLKTIMKDANAARWGEFKAMEAIESKEKLSFDDYKMALDLANDAMEKANDMRLEASRNRKARKTEKELESATEETNPAEQSKEKAGFTDDEINTLTDRGFKRWTKKLSNGKVMDRLYIKPEYLGLELTRYKSGNISSATFNGERISNSEARRIEGTKCYVDVATKEVVCDRDDLKQVAQEVIDDALSKEKSQVLAQAETKKAAPKDDVKTIKKSLLNLATKVWQNPRAQGKVTFYPSQKLKDKVKELFGHDIDTVFITADDIRHIKSGHSEHEENRGQINLSEQDIPDIYDVVNDFDNVTKLQSDAKGNQKIMFVKDVNGKMISLLIERGKHKAQVKTAYKKQVQMSDVTSPEPNVLNDSVPASTSIISQKAEKGNKPDELRNQLSNGGKQAYDYAFDKLSQGHEKVAQSAKESAFIYARMAERWSEIMHEYGNKTYSPEDYTKSHPIVMGQQSGNAQLERAFEQRAWHGSGVDFDNFDLGKIGSGTGASMHGWGIYAAKSKRIAQKYKKEMKDRGLPSVLYEIDVPANKELLDEDKRYKDQMKGVQTKILKAVQSLSLEQKQAFWTKWLRQAMGSTKDEIQAETALRTVELNIKHCHDASLEWEGLPAFRKRIALNSLKKQGYTDEQINDTSYMESESKRWEKELPAAQQQVEDAKGAGNKKRKQLIEAAMENPEATLEKGIGTGKEIYNYLTDALSDGKDIEKTSKYLNEQGIHGITYDDAYDGRCYVVFDDKAIQIIDKYNQDVHNAKAAYDASTGAIRLFDIADQSSFIHESAHMFLSDMERLARKKDAPAGLVSDLQTVKDWAGYKPGQMNGYKGTALEKKFQEYADAIREAKKTGDVVAIKSAETRWIHERFARGFERYIADGKAPNESLKNVFEKFKGWMVSIYQDLKNLGKKPPKEIQDVMARMIAPKTDTKYSAREAHEQLTRSKEDLKAEIKEAFPNAKEIKDEGDRMTFTMPNGSHIVVDAKNEILLTDEELAQAKKDHHIDDNGNVVVEGYAQLHGKDAYMALSQGSRENTGFHEVYHLAEGAVLTDREKAAIKKAIPDAEKRADKYAEWVEARKHGRGTAWGKLFQKIKDFAAKMRKIFTRVENVHDVFRQIESGEVWERNAKTSNVAWTSVTNTAITGKTRVPIVDVSNWGRMNLTNTAKKKAIIEELKGASFKFIDSQGRFATKLDSKHFVNSSSSIQIHLKTRQKIFSNIGEILNNAIYVEKHPDVRHGKSGEYIELFSAVKDGGKIVLFRIVAKEGDKTVGRYNIGDVKFYDILQQKKDVPHHLSHSDRQNGGTSLDTVSVSDLLRNVNDRHNRPYVNSDGSLNYEFGVLKALPTNKTSYSVRKEGATNSTIDQEEAPVKPQDIIDAINDIVHIYEGSRLTDKERKELKEASQFDPDQKQAVRPQATDLYDRHAHAGFNRMGYFNLSNYGRILALHLDNVMQLKGNLELANKVLDRQDKNAAENKMNGVNEHLTPAQARQNAVMDFGAMMIRNPELARETYPAYSKIFDEGLEQHPDLKEKLDKVIQLNETYHGQTAAERAAGSIAREKEKVQLRKHPKEWLHTHFDKFYTNWVDDKHAFAKVVARAEAELGRKLAYDYDVHKQAQMAINVASSRALLFLTGGKGVEETYKVLNKVYGHAITKNVTMKDIMDALNKVSKEDVSKTGAENAYDALGNYLIAMRTEELEKHYHDAYARSAGFDEEGTQEIIQNTPESIKKIAQMYWDINTNILNILQQQGLISKDLAGKLRKYKHYCPMYRDMSDGITDMDEMIGTIGVFNKGGGYANVSNGIKRIEGGGKRPILDPITSLSQMAVSMISKCERNDVAKTFVKLGQDFSGLGDVVVRDPTLKHADPTAFAFTVWQNGEQVVYRTTPEIYDALTNNDAQTNRFTIKMASSIAQTLRTGATISPSFIVRNLLRDTMSATVNSKTGFYLPFVDNVRGAWKLHFDKEFSAEYHASGASMSTYMRADADSSRDLTKELLGHKYDSYPVVVKQVRQLISYAWHKYEKFGNLIEDSTRAGEFRRARNQGLSIDQAGQLAREITLDFSRHGKKGQMINKYVPFFNATIQGTDKFIRTFKDNPMRAILNTVIWIILPSLGLWAINHDDDWYKELDENTKYTNWAIPLPGGTHLLIPKPQEVGILFGSGIEAVLNQMTGTDPHGMKEWARQYAEAMTPSLYPAVVRPLIEWMTNYSFWTGRNLVPASLQKAPSEMQFTSYTSELAKSLGDTWLAKSIKLSPIAIDNWISGWFGSAGRFIANMLNDPISYVRGNSRPPEPAKYWYEMPVIGSFVRQNGQNSEYVNRMYEVQKDMNDDYERSDAGKQRKGKKSSSNKPKELKQVDTAVSSVSKLNKEIKAIRNDPKKDPDRKRQEIDQRRTKINDLAKKVVLKFDK